MRRCNKMDNDSLLSVFLMIAIITVSAIDIIIIYMFISSFCCKRQQVRNDQIDDLRKPFISPSVNEHNDGYYTSL